jgi:hypothetical protein
MTQPVPTLAALWAEHLAKALPRDRPESEYGGLDFVDLVELDGFLAGHISRIASGKSLSNTNLSGLIEAKEELETCAQSLQGVTAAYYQSLLSVTRAAVEQSRRSAE